MATSPECAYACGQAISSRPDVAPPSYTQELEKLQDQIPPFPTEEAMAVMQRDMGLPPSSVFSYLTPEPVAAASLGQVRPCHCTSLIGSYHTPKT